MQIPDFIMEDIQKKPTDNAYFYHAEDAFKRMTVVNNKHIDYCFDDYSVLINTLERYYKGYIQSKLDSIPEYKIPIDFLTRGHNIKELVEEIECNFIPLSKELDKNERNIRRHFFDCLKKMYTASRYSEYPTFTEFQELYRFVEKQREIILNDLKKEKTKGCNFLNEEYDDFD